MCADTFCKWKYVNKEDEDKTFIMFYFLIKDDYNVGIEHFTYARFEYLSKIFKQCFEFFGNVNSIKS